MAETIRVLYSFPHKLGADRICTTAWYQVHGADEAGARVLVCPSSITRPLPESVEVRPTLARGRARVPYRLIGRRRAFALHDYVVSRRLERWADVIDVVHVWPLGALRTLKVAARLGIPSVLERPNAHTRFAYAAVAEECRKLGITLPDDHEHAFNADILAHEEAEYKLATHLLCPSDFVARTFRDEGFPEHRLLRHQYGFDATRYSPSDRVLRGDQGLTMLFVGGCAPRKGLHYALEAWLASAASARGRFLIAGAFVPGYAERLAPLLAHPSVEVLGHRTDVEELMRRSDLLVLPSIEEGSALVTSEARGSGCVLLVSDAAGAVCVDGVHGLVHRAGDVVALTRHLDSVEGDRALLATLRATSLAGVADLTWSAAGRRLVDVYRHTLATDRAPGRAGLDAALARMS